MKLGAYKINNVPVSDLEAIVVDDLNGNPPYVVADSLSAAYQDITSVENFDLFGSALLGSVYGFKDWKCLQREIKELVLDIVDGDLNANWNNLNDSEKLITCRYLTSKVPPAKFLETVPDVAERTNISIDFDVNNRRARGSWLNATGRIQIMRIYLFGKIGTDNALLVFHDVVRDGLLELYEGGIEGTEEDGNIGIIDFLLSRAGYSVDGLTTRNYPVIDGSGDTLDEVASALSEIAINGMY